MTIPQQDTILVTPRLRLEPIHHNHAPLLFEMLMDITMYTFIPTEPPVSVEALVSRFRQLESRQSPDGQEQWLNWAVCLQGDGSYIGLVQATVQANHTAFLAYQFHHHYRQQGYATEACQRVMAEVMTQYLVTTFMASVDTRNLASIHLLERLGFHLSATISQADYFKGSWSDEYLYIKQNRPPNG